MAGGIPQPNALASMMGGQPGGAPPQGPPPGPPQPPGAAPPGGALAGMPMQIMMLAFLAGAGMDKIVGSISKMRDIVSGKAGGTKTGPKADAAGSGGMSISPQIAQMLAQNPGLAARLMQMVKQQMPGAGGPPAGGGMM